jgi:3-dehydroquinate synthase
MIEIKSNNYSVFISNGITKELNRFFKSNKNKYSRIFILVDENTLTLCYPQLVSEVEAFKKAEIIEIESGEENKTIEVCIQIWSALSEMKADRSSLFINLGGGVIGDMGGFIASTFKRGIDFINIPTTLLSQVDASVGGKVGIDLNHLKNEIGVFNNPVNVFIDTALLSTLDKRQVLSGFAEMIKHALIADANYWKQIKLADFSSLKNFDSLIETSVNIKNTIVQQDPFEKNIRKALNFGHTIGHAVETFFIEKYDNNKILLHGEAIAIGVVCEAYLSNCISKLSSKELKEITSFILSIYKPVKFLEKDFNRLIELMQHDKKNEKGQINFTLISSIGDFKINNSVQADLIIESLKFYMSQVKLMSRKN